MAWEGARCGTVGGVDCAAGARDSSVRVKKLERWFGLGVGDMDLFGDDSMSGLVGGVVPFVTALSDMSSSDRGDEPVDEADIGWMSGALYDNMLVVWTSWMGFEILLRIEPTDPLVELLR